VSDVPPRVSGCRNRRLVTILSAVRYSNPVLEVSTGDFNSAKIIADEDGRKSALFEVCILAP